VEVLTPAAVEEVAGYTNPESVGKEGVIGSEEATMEVGSPGFAGLEAAGGWEVAEGIGSSEVTVERAGESEGLMAESCQVRRGVTVRAEASAAGAARPPTEAGKAAKPSLAATGWQEQAVEDSLRLTQAEAAQWRPVAAAEIQQQ
jgi:hypothetical protein